MRYSMEKKWIEHNKKEFGVEIIELKRIISEQVRNGGKSDEFISDMVVALVTGRKITPKMKDAIDNIIKQNNPDEQYKREEWLQSVLPKLLMVQNMISDTDWSDGYRASSVNFMESIIKQAKHRKKLSKKQMEAVSKLWVKIKNNVEKKS